MKKLKLQIAIGLGTLFAWKDRLFAPRNSVALANNLALINETGIESLFVDPASVNLPFPSRYLLIQRGGSGYQYGDVAQGVNCPLGISSDSPYAIGDVLNVRRLGARPGLEIGLGIAAKTVTIDNLLVAAAGGTVQDASTITTNATYWVVGRAAATLSTTASTQEVQFIPCVPFKATYTSGVWSMAAPA